MPCRFCGGKSTLYGLRRGVHRACASKLHLSSSTQPTAEERLAQGDLEDTFMGGVCGANTIVHEYHIAFNAWKRCRKRVDAREEHYKGIHDRFLRDQVFRES